MSTDQMKDESTEFESTLSAAEVQNFDFMPAAATRDHLAQLFNRRRSIVDASCRVSLLENGGIKPSGIYWHDFIKTSASEEHSS